MPVPLSASPSLATYLEGLEGRLEDLETAKSPRPVYACATALMPSAADFPNCVLRNTTLDILAVSNGTDWIRQDTGAAI